MVVMCSFSVARLIALLLPAGLILHKHEETISAGMALIAALAPAAHRENIRRIVREHRAARGVTAEGRRRHIGLRARTGTSKHMTETPTDSLVFKQATESWEFGEVHRLNYDTFVEEIPQHEPNTDRRLVDKFHSENVYFVCLSGRELLGMVAVRGKRPFSLDQKLENLDSYLPAGRTVCEIRLLSVRPNRRNGHVFHGLLRTVLDYCIPAGYDMAVISGTVRQDRLYRHLGFVPFGPRVGAGAALYQPMYLTAEAFDATALKMRETRPTTAVTDGRPGPGTEDRSALPASFLPGPVNVHPDVMAALSGAPVSHRSESFIRDVAETRRMLRDLTGAQHVEILQGSGTLANETVAGELACSGERGLLLSNGEFGGRLIDHATRWQLDFSVLSSDWGAPFDYAELERALHADPDVRWVWCAHCETSTGVLNDLERLETCCRKRNVDLCLDAISSVGTVPVNLRHVRLASCVSGKGLAAFPGLAIVFCVESHATPRRSLPRYIDLSYYAEKSGIPFTLSSNLLHALQAALKRLSPTERFEHIRQVGAWLRGELRAQGFHIVAADDHASPAVVTIALPEGLDSGTVGRAMEAQGIIVSYNSEYLLKKRWIQFFLMGECAQIDLAAAVARLAALTH